MRDWKDMSQWDSGREYPSPEKVKAWLAGGGSTSDGLSDARETLEGYAEDPNASTAWKTFAQGALAALGQGQVMRDEVDGVTFVDLPHSNLIYAGPSRCPTCGRAFDCCCPGCPHCVEGRPRQERRTQ